MADPQHQLFERRTKKKLVIAFSLAIDPKWAPCGECGCIDGEASYDKWELDGVLKTRTCPRKLIDADDMEWLRYFKHYQAGHLLIAGGIADQPNAYLEAMNLIGSLLNKEHGYSTSKIHDQRRG